MAIYRPQTAIVRKMAIQLAKREGKKSQAKMGDIFEICKLIVEYDSEFELGSLESPIYAMSQLSDFKRKKKLLAVKKKAQKK